MLRALGKRPWMVFALTGLLAFLVGISPTSVASVHAAPIPTATYSIKYYDASGHLIKSWRGSYAEQQHLLQLERAKHPAPRPANISPLINRVDPCSDPNDFVDLRNYPPLVCFANAGMNSINVYSVYEVDSGANAGAFYIYPHAFPVVEVDFGKFEAHVCGGCTWYDIVEVRII